jgi:hypothetical protein
MLAVELQSFVVTHHGEFHGRFEPDEILLGEDDLAARDLQLLSYTLDGAAGLAIERDDTDLAGERDNQTALA